MRHVPALTINVLYFGDKPTLSISVGARYPAEFNATSSILQREGKPATYLVALQGHGVPKTAAEGRDVIEAAITLGYRTAKYIEQIDDGLAACPPAPYIAGTPETDSDPVETSLRRAPE